jgi:hypothetical protein
MSLIDTGAAWLGDQLIDHASHAVAYTQGGTTIALRGTRSAELVRVQSTTGATMISRQTSFLFRTVDVTLTPQRGDLLAETVNGSTVYWEVTPDVSGSLWQYESAGEELIRVFVAEAAAWHR